MHGENKVARVRTKRRFDNTDLCRGGIKTCECAPVIDNQPSTDYIGTSIHSSSLRNEDVQRAVPDKRGKRDGRLAESVADWTARPGLGSRSLDGRGHPDY
jgi:hypothetical protein